MKRGGDLLRRQDRTHRETAAERFRAGQNIRRHAVVHIGKQVPGTSHPALHFIKHQQRLMFVAQRAQPFQEFRGCRGHAAFPLNRLDHHRAGVVVHHRFHRVQIVKRHVDDVGRFRTKPVGILRLAANGDGKEGASVEGIVEGDDFGFVRAVARGRVVARQLKGGFVGFGAGVHKQHALGKRGINDLTAQAQRRFVGEHVAGVPQGFTLGFQRLHQRGMAMTQRRDRNTAREIHILLALLIPDAAAFPLHRDKFSRCINRQNHFIECRAGNCWLFSCHVMPIHLCHIDCENIITKYA